MMSAMSKSRSTGLLFLGGVILLFIPMFVVNYFLAYYAITTNTGLVDDQAYNTGQNYNSIIKSAHQQEKLAWKTTLTLTPIVTKPHTAKLDIAINDSQNETIKNLTIVAILYSPVDPQPDQKLSLLSQEDGHFFQEVTVPRSGQWEIRLVAKTEDKQYGYQQRLFFP